MPLLTLKMERAKSQEMQVASKLRVRPSPPAHTHKLTDSKETGTSSYNHKELDSPRKELRSLEQILPPSLQRNAAQPIS